VLLQLGGKTTFICSRAYALFTLHTLLNTVICCSQLNTCGVLGLIRHKWIISHRCSWMAVYVSCCNAQSKSRSDPLDISHCLYSVNCPTIICLPSMCYFILWRATSSELWTPVLFPLYCFHLFTLLTLFTLLAYYYCFPLDTLIPFVSSKPVRLTTSS
jgi:hypothetical protein